MLPEPEKKPGISLPAKVTAISAATILLGLGLCGIGGLNLNGSSITAEIGILAFLGGIVGFLVGVLWWFISAISK